LRNKRKPLYYKGSDREAESKDGRFFCA